LYVADTHLRAAVGHASDRDLQLNAFLGGGASLHTYDRCTLEIANSAADGAILPLNSDEFDPQRVVFNDCRFKFGGAGQRIECGGIVDINGGGLTADSAQITGLFPATHVNPGGEDGSYVVVTGFDLSRAAQGLNIFDGSSDHHMGGGSRVVLRDCKMPDNWNGALFGSALAYTSYTWLLKRAPADRVGTFAYVNPAIATVLGWAVLGEALTGIQIVGVLVILGAVVLVTWSSGR
jgi:hypothetical protein